MDENAFKKQIGVKTRQLRTVKGWSRQQVADKLEMSATAYGSIERGETDVCITRLAQIAEIFEIALTDLLGVTEKTVFNFAQENNRKCNNWQIASPPDKINESTLKNDLEKCQLIQQAQTKEIEYLKQQISQLQEIIALIKTKSD